MHHVSFSVRICWVATAGLIECCFVFFTAGDYKMLEGYDIPYRRLGYPTLEQFLESVPDVSLSLGQGGELVLQAIPNKNTAHVASLVSKQKSVSKRTRSSSGYVSTKFSWLQLISQVRQFWLNVSFTLSNFIWIVLIFFWGGVCV
jgi:hypothetical protein